MQCLHVPAYVSLKRTIRAHVRAHTSAANALHLSRRLYSCITVTHFLCTLMCVTLSLSLSHIHTVYVYVPVMHCVCERVCVSVCRGSISGSERPGAEGERPHDGVWICAAQGDKFSSRFQWDTSEAPVVNPPPPLPPPPPSLHLGV